MSSPQGLNADGQGARALCRHVCLQELVEVTVVQVLHDDAQRLFVAAHAKYPRDVRILQGSQDPHITMEVQPKIENPPSYKGFQGSESLLVPL